MHEPEFTDLKTGAVRPFSELPTSLLLAIAAGDYDEFEDEGRGPDSEAIGRAIAGHMARERCY